MNAGDRWMRDEEAPPPERTLADAKPVPVPAPIEQLIERVRARGDGAQTPKREPIDLDRLIEVALTFGGVAFYFGGAAFGAFLLGGWVGAFALAAFGMPPVVYALVKSSQRRAEREHRRHFEGQRERTNHDVTAIDIPIR